MDHLKHKTFVTGVPLRPYWSDRQIYCSTCKIYFRFKPLYLFYGIKWELRNLDNRFYRIMLKLKLLKIENHQLKWFFENGKHKSS